MTRSPSAIILKSAIALPVSLRSFLCSLLRSCLSIAISMIEHVTRWSGILHAKITTAKFLASNLPLVWLLISASAEAGVILLYHHVDDATPRITSIAPDQFDRHLTIIEEQGFSVLPLEQLVANSLSGEDATTKREVAITFDDAYASIYHEAFPRLKARGWPFTIFVSPAFVRNNSTHYLSWQQLDEMAENGARLENHSQNHHHLIRRENSESLTDWQARVTQEISQAGDELETRGHPSRFFAYPYGEYNLALLNIVGQLGLIGLGQQSGAVGPDSNPQLLPRFPLAGIYVGEDAFRDKLRSLPMPVRQLEVEPLVTDEYRPTLTLNFTAGAVPRQLACYGPGGRMSLVTISPGTATATPVEEIGIGRSRYNCTSPNGTRFHWFSQLWIRKEADGSWYPEP